MSDDCKLCLCGCGRPACVRGLYWTCYTVRREQVRKGKTTWEAEEAAGRALAPRGRKVAVEVPVAPAEVANARSQPPSDSEVG